MLGTWVVWTGVSTHIVDINKGSKVCRDANGIEPQMWEILDSFNLAALLWAQANKRLS